MAVEAERLAAEGWFQQRGMPLVVHRSARSRRLVQRAVPALAALLVLAPLLIGAEVVVELDTGDATEGEPSTVVVLLVLVLVVAALPGLPTLVGWVVGKVLGRLSNRAQLVVAGVLVALAVFGVPVLAARGALLPYWVGVAVAAASVLLLLWLVRVGAGAISMWAIRKAVRQIGSVGTMASRVLPLMLLVVMFAFFTGELWQAAGALSRPQLWLVVAFLALIATGFLVATFSDELPALRAAAARRDDLHAELQHTPLAGGPPVGTAVALSRAERINVTLVLLLAQAVQVIAFAVVVFVFFVVFGALMVTPEVQAAYLGAVPPAPGVLFGFTLPVSNALVQVSVFLAVFCGLYFTASTTTDERYRRAFFEPLLDEVALSLAARDVYRERWP